MTKKSEVHKIMSALAGRSELVKSAWTWTRTQKQDLRTDCLDVQKDVGKLGRMLPHFLNAGGEENNSAIGLRGDWADIIKELYLITNEALEIDQEHTSLVRSVIEDSLLTSLKKKANDIAGMLSNYKENSVHAMARTKKISEAVGNQGYFESLESIVKSISSGLNDVQAGLQELRFETTDGKIGIYSGRNERTESKLPNQAPESDENIPGPWAAPETTEIDVQQIKIDYLSLQENLKAVIKVAANVHGNDDPGITAILDKFSAVPAIKTFFRFNIWIKEMENKQKKLHVQELDDEAKLMFEKMKKFFPAAKTAVGELKKEIEALES